MMRIAKGFLVAGVVLLGACGGDTVEEVTNVIDCRPALFDAATPAVPACTVPVNFVVDDTANGVFADGEMLWKGSMKYDPLTRIAYKDASWSGPFAPLYDDGAWDDPVLANRGHEPSGQVKGDHIFGITVFVHPPTAGTENYEYGLIDHVFGDGWIWKKAGGGNGQFTLEAGRTAPVDTLGMTFPAFGTIDLKLTIDLNNLAGGFDYAGLANKVPVQVKGSAWAWNDVILVDDGQLGDDVLGDGIFTFVLSEYAGPGKTYYHTGLTATGDQPEFVFAFGPGHVGDATYTEYKVSSIPPTAGVAAYTKTPPAVVWTAQTVGNLATNSNTYITVP